MNQPIWDTPAGSIGIFNETIPISYTFSARTVRTLATKTNAASTDIKISNTLECVDTSFLKLNQPISFLGNGFGGINIGPNYYVKEIVSSTRIKISQTLTGPILSLINDTGNITLVTLNTLKYELLNGDLPISTNDSTNFTLTNYGDLAGTPGQVSKDTTTSFTIRVTEYYNDNTILSFADRTFSITIIGTTIPYFITPEGELYKPAYYLKDSTWNPVQIQIYNPDPNTTATIKLLAGHLPPGLEINSSGLIRGYAEPPTVNTISVDFKTYEFTLKVESESGSNIRNFQITVSNQQLIPNYSGRKPVILNRNHPSFFISPLEQYSAYYTNGTLAGVFPCDNYFIFKIIGKDFDNKTLKYDIYGTLPNGVNFDRDTGYITGYISPNPSTLLTQTYQVTAIVTNSDNLQSNTVDFYFVIVNVVNNVPINLGVEWTSDSFLGNINNGETSTFYVEAQAVSGVELNYSLVTGSLPTNLELLPTGEIVGRLPFEPQKISTPVGQTNTYQFSVLAKNLAFTEIYSVKTFTITTYQKFVEPYETLYIKGLIGLDERTKITALLQNTDIIPSQCVYRLGDEYFGKARGITYQHMFGVPAKMVIDYIAAAEYNHYWRNLTLGPLRTAIAKTSDNKILYEVVYSEIIDNLSNVNGKSISKSQVWPILIDSQKITVYPNSLSNMRQQIQDSFTDMISDSSILPLWMTSQQSNGSSLGFTEAWVICYTKPGYSEIIKNNIETNWGHSLNEINFKIDRFEVDKRLTHNFDSITKSWGALPSASLGNDSQDKYVYFPQNNILSSSKF
jgi:hypothetical protein